MGGGHHEPPYKIPDYTIYKIEEVPELKQVQRALARHGLKDPWLRNEVWRYHPKEAGTHAQRLTKFLFRGFPLGFAAFVATIGIEFVLSKFSGKGGHGHGHSSSDHKK